MQALILLQEELLHRSLQGELTAEDTPFTDRAAVLVIA
jgi:hypothetical protein